MMCITGSAPCYFMSHHFNSINALASILMDKTFLTNSYSESPLALNHVSHELFY